MYLIFEAITSLENLIIAVGFIGGYVYLQNLRLIGKPRIDLTQIDILILSSIYSLGLAAISFLIVFAFIPGQGLSLKEYSMIGAAGSVILGSYLGYVKQSHMSLKFWISTKHSFKYGSYRDKAVRMGFLLFTALAHSLALELATPMLNLSRGIEAAPKLLISVILVGYAFIIWQILSFITTRAFTISANTQKNLKDFN